MRRLLVVVAAGLALAGPAAACTPKTSLLKLENEVMCPVCQSETIAQSDTQAAAQIRRFIQGRVKACASEAQIKRELAAQYGTQILAAPPRHGFGWLAWLLPGEDEPRESPLLAGSALDPELQRRLDDELRRFDG